ncbi:MAG: hypothetical protein JWP74_3131 [Marmoricola sp.]|nr:hypothetical protein [Marmoricola sp.]
MQVLVGATTVAHGIHYGVLGVGLLGLICLLAPQFLPARRIRYDEHERRVLHLADQIAAGTLGHGVDLPAAPVPAPLVRQARTDPLARTLLPLAVVSSAAAAGVHAAVGPEHFRERFLFGLFFSCSALAQMLWAAAMIRRPSRRLILAAVLGNAAVVVLWLVTRTVGLPFGLLPKPEEIGPWDVSSVVWELTIVAAGTAMLHARAPGTPSPRLSGWGGWSQTARVWTIASTLVLVTLSLRGVSS